MVYERQVRVTLTAPQAALIYRILKNAKRGDQILQRQLGVEERVDGLVLENGIKRLTDAIDKRNAGMDDKIERRYPGYKDFNAGIVVVSGECSELSARGAARKNADGQRPHNVHCANCKDTRGGPLGHTTEDCTWDGIVDAPLFGM